MIPPKPKPCRGSGPAKDFKGCGTLSDNRHYGLCPNCYRDFLLNTPQGRAILQRTSLQAKKKVKAQKKKEYNQQRKQEKEAIKQKKDYERDLQTIFNAIVRLVDDGKGCISCDHGWLLPWSRQKHAGHRLSVGSDPSLRYNMFNCFTQCSICNNWKSANEREYDKGLVKHYGPRMLETVQSLKADYPVLKLTIPELKEAIQRAKTIKKRLLDGEDFTREEINQYIGIYKTDSYDKRSTA